RAGGEGRDERGDRDREHRHRDQHLDEAEPVVFCRRPQPAQERPQVPDHGYLSCCHEPGTPVQLTWSGPLSVDVVVEEAPGAPGGGSIVDGTVPLPDSFAVSAITAPCRTELPDPLKTPFVKATPSNVCCPAIEKPGLALAALTVTISRRFWLVSYTPLQALPELGVAQTFAWPSNSAVP